MEKKYIVFDHSKPFLISIAAFFLASCVAIFVFLQYSLSEWIVGVVLCVLLFPVFVWSHVCDRRISNLKKK